MSFFCTILTYLLTFDMLVVWQKLEEKKDQSRGIRV